MAGNPPSSMTGMAKSVAGSSFLVNELDWRIDDVKTC